MVEESAAGVTLGHSFQRLNLKLTDAEYADYLKSGILFRASVSPKAGMATVRVIVADPSTAMVGSVIIPAAQIQ